MCVFTKEINNFPNVSKKINLKKYIFNFNDTGNLYY